MLSTIRASVANIAAGSLVLTAAFALVTYSWLSIEEAGRDSALAHAESWIETAFSEAPTLEQLIAGAHLDLTGDHQIGVAARASKVVYYDLFGPNGAPLNVDHENFMGGDVFLAQAQRAARRAALTGEPVTFQTGASQNGPAMARVFIPIERDGAVIAVVSPVVDNDVEINHGRDAFLTMLIAALTLAGTALAGTICVAIILRRQRLAEERLHHLASHDPLTGLANRATFAAVIAKATSTAARRKSNVALTLIDVDYFKSINDVLGHEMGDRLLCEISALFRDHASDGDLVARLGGDEFAVVQVVRGEADAVHLVRRLIAAVRQVDHLGSTPVTLSISAGVALYDRASDPDELQRLADAALYVAKEAGRDQYVVFEPGMENRIRWRSRVRALIRKALAEGAFEVHYQPTHDTLTGELRCFEALVRLPDDGGHHVSPAEFIPVAEDIGVASQIGELVMRDACAAASRWPASISVAVNLSPVQFREDVSELVRHALSSSGLAPSRLEVEVTEAVFMENPQRVDHQLRQIKHMGVRVVMDDFGAGASSLRYLWQFPFDKLKVDRSCFALLENSEEAREVLRSIGAMSVAMQLRVTAEGVETVAQRAYAQEAGCSEIQGFLYHQPMPADAVDGYISNARTQALQPAASMIAYTQAAAAAV